MAEPQRLSQPGRLSQTGVFPLTSDEPGPLTAIGAKPREYLLESIVYEKEPAAMEQSAKMSAAYVDGIKALPADKIEGRKDEVKEMVRIFQYLSRHKLLVDFAPGAELKKFAEEKGWVKK